MREGPQLGVDAFSISNYGSAMLVLAQAQHSTFKVVADAFFSKRHPCTLKK